MILSIPCARMGAALLLGALTAPAWSLDLAEPPALVVGEKWTYQLHNKGDKREPYLYSHQVKSVEAGSAWIDGRSSEPNSQRPRYIWRQDMRTAEFVERFDVDDAAPNGVGKRSADRSRNEHWLQFPLQVGKKYKLKRAWDNGRGFDDLTAEVQAFEKVKVEAGEFDAYRIKYSGFWNQREGGSYSGQIQHLVWYAPAAKTTVKWHYTNRTSNGGSWNDMVTELVKWEPATSN